MAVLHLICWAVEHGALWLLPGGAAVAIIRHETRRR